MAAMLIAVAVVAGTIGGFTVSAAAGWYTLAAFTFVLGMLLAVSDAPAPVVPIEAEPEVERAPAPAPEEPEVETPEPQPKQPTRRGGRSR